MGMVDDRRGDAYMNAFQPAIATCPWFPIIGNHEAADGDQYGIFLWIVTDVKQLQPLLEPNMGRGLR